MRENAPGGGIVSVDIHRSCPPGLYEGGIPPAPHLPVQGRPLFRRRAVLGARRTGFARRANTWPGWTQLPRNCVCY